jgi:uncharacterized protein (TIGR02391 family)
VELSQLSTEELGLTILQYAKEGVQQSLKSMGIFDAPINASVDPYPVQYASKIKESVALALSWLQSERFIVAAPGQAGGYYKLTDRGRELDSAESLKAYLQSKLLNRDLLHPKIAARAWDHFRHGRYDDAILGAFKEIEVAVRQAGGFTTSDYGVPLMIAAFNANNGRLHDPTGVDPNATPGERAAWANLFAGAIGVHKNPQSHRWVGVDQAIPTIEALVLASHLYRLLEARLVVLGKPLPS